MCRGNSCFSFSVFFSCAYSMSRWVLPRASALLADDPRAGATQEPRPVLSTERVVGTLVGATAPTLSNGPFVPCRGGKDVGPRLLVGLPRTSVGVAAARVRT